MSCHVCGAPGKSVVEFEHALTSESKVLPNAASLLLCTGCGLLHTQTDLDLAAYYAHQYDATLSDDGMDEIVSTKDGSVVFRTDLDYALMMKHVGGLATRDSALFELGCGRGRILSRLHKDGFRNLSAFDLAEEYRAGASHFCEGRVFIGQRPSIKCDLAYSLFVLEHDADPVGSVRYLWEILHPGGYLYLMLPNYVTNVVDLACSDHVNHFSSRYLETLLPACGFEIIQVDSQSNVGSTAILARRVEGHPADPWSFVQPELVAYGTQTLVPFLDYLRDLRAVIARLERSRPVYLYGAGFYAALVASELAAVGLSVTGLFDANPRKTGRIMLGSRVRGAGDLPDAGLSDASLIVCVNPLISQAIASRYAPYVGAVFTIAGAALQHDSRA